MALGIGNGVSYSINGGWTESEASPPSPSLFCKWISKTFQRYNLTFVYAFLGFWELGVRKVRSHTNIGESR